MEKNYIASSAQLDLVKTFECGQCFRWVSDENGVYTGIAYGRILKIWREGADIFCSAPEDDLPFWRIYLDLNDDYSCANASFSSPEYLKECAEYGKGIRILRQEPWEALCSFIISQCNNIPRIKKIVSILCRLYGEELSPGMFSFPDADIISQLQEEDLAPIRSGYRAAYVLAAAKAVSSGSISLEALRTMPAEEALEKIKSLPGVGSKVASCFMLYGLHRMDRFPIDTWIKKALSCHFPPDFDPAELGPWSGLAQQYIFFYTRTNEQWQKNKKIVC